MSSHIYSRSRLRLECRIASARNVALPAESSRVQAKIWTTFWRGAYLPACVEASRHYDGRRESPDAAPYGHQTDDWLRRGLTISQ